MPICVEKNKLDIIMNAIGPHFNLSTESVYAAPYLPVPDDDEEQDDDEEDFPVNKNGISVIPIIGTLVQRSTGMDAPSGLVSYEKLARQIKAATSDPAVRAVALDIDSGGGEVPLMLETSDLIYSLRGAKPLIAVANATMASAAFCIGSAADQVIVTRTAMVGSVGCFMIHVDQSQRDKQAGLKYTYASAGSRKVSGNPHSPLDSSTEQTMQDEVNRVRHMFIMNVARNRPGSSIKSLYETEAGVTFGAASIPLYADGVSTLDDVVSALSSRQASRSYSIPAAARPAAHHQRLIEAPAADWLESHSNLMPHASLNAVVDRMRAEQSAGREPRLIALPGSRAAASDISAGRRISLLVCPYNSASTPIDGAPELYMPGCFTQGLGGDLRASFNHNPDCILGRVSAGTCSFFEQADGVHGWADLPQANWADDLLASIRRKDITGASAAFFILEAHYELRQGIRVRIVTRAQLVEGSVASYPVYPAATATVAPATQLPTAALRRRLDAMRAPVTVADYRRKLEAMRRQ